LITGNEGIRRLNKEWLGRDNPTNVLSFPQLHAKNDLPSLDGEGQTNLLGDVVINIERAQKDASLADIPIEAELTWLLIHGVLHLCGFEHENTTRANIRKMHQKAMELYNELSPIMTETFIQRA